MMTGDRPTPSLFLTRRAQLPFAAAFLVEPIRPGGSSALTLTQAEARNGLAFTVHRADGSEDRILLGDGAAESGGLASDGLLTLIRVDGDRPIAAMAAGAESATLNGTPINDLDLPVRWL